MAVSIELLTVEGPGLVDVARELFREYEAAIGVDLEYQGFSTELAGLPAPYQPPFGALVIAQVDGAPAGCVALRRLDDRTGEMKRLYVRPGHRGLRLGERLVDAVVSAARKAGYEELRLDTLASMHSAQQLYAKLGFEEIPPYNDKYLPRTKFYSLRLK